MDKDYRIVRVIKSPERVIWRVFAHDDSFVEPISQHETRAEAQRAVERYRANDKRRRSVP
jgi:hypothetical protein